MNERRFKWQEPGKSEGEGGKGPREAGPGRGGGTHHPPSPGLALAALLALPGTPAWPSPVLPCDISKEAFERENISFSQSSFKAGGVLATGSCQAWPHQPAPPPVASLSAQRPSFGPAGSYPAPGPPSDSQQATEPLPETRGEDRPSPAHSGKQHGAQQGRREGARAETRMQA